MIRSLETEGEENSGVMDVANRLAINNSKLTIARMKGKSSEMKPLIGEILLDIARIGKSIRLTETFVDLAEEAFKAQNKKPDF